MSFNIIVNSDMNLDYYPSNKPFKFWTHLKTPLNLKGLWKVALVDIKIDIDPLFEHKTYIYIAMYAASLLWMEIYILYCDEYV